MNTYSSDICIYFYKYARNKEVSRHVYAQAQL